MPVKAVYLSADTYLACLSHAFSTEEEEIMGLLIGNVTEDETTGECISCIESVIVLRRSDRKPDRVEISPLQLSTAAQEAEQLSDQLGRPLRVLGWYHSHPHITVGPSHVDVRTQAMYQTMDPDFVGLILSVYEQGAGKFAGTKITCFQAEGSLSEASRKEVPLFIIPQMRTNEHCLQALVEIPQMFYSEEDHAFEASINPETDFVAQLYNEAVFIQAACRLVERVGFPLLSAMKAYISTLEMKLASLKN